LSEEVRKLYFTSIFAYLLILGAAAATAAKAATAESEAFIASDLDN